MKEVEFKDYSAKYKDADGDEHTSTVSAHVANKESAELLGTVLSHAGPHVVRDGDVLVKTERPDFYDVHSKKSWDEIGYAEGDGKSAPLVNDDSADEGDDKPSSAPDREETSNAPDSDQDDNTTPTRTPAKTTARRGN